MDTESMRTRVRDAYQDGLQAVVALVDVQTIPSTAATIAFVIGVLAEETDDAPTTANEGLPTLAGTTGTRPTQSGGMFLVTMASAHGEVQLLDVGALCGLTAAIVAGGGDNAGVAGELLGGREVHARIEQV